MQQIRRKHNFTSQKFSPEIKLLEKNKEIKMTQPLSSLFKQILPNFPGEQTAHKRSFK